MTHAGDATPAGWFFEWKSSIGPSGLIAEDVADGHAVDAISGYATHSSPSLHAGPATHGGYAMTLQLSISTVSGG